MNARIATSMLTDGTAPVLARDNALPARPPVTPVTPESPTSRALGTHLVADFWETRTIASVEELDAVVRAAVAAADATLLDLTLHAFPGHGGITGYALLAESHLSVHTWPERGYVAIDVFMCGDQRAEDALAHLRQAFAPAREQVHSLTRGLPPEGGTGAIDARTAGER